MRSFFGKKSVLETGKKEPSNPTEAKEFSTKHESKEPISPKKENTKVIIRYNVGFKNNLFIRGKGAGLNWEHGIQLKNTGTDEWVWETSMPFNECEFKVLINDHQYEAGENHRIHNGVTVQYTPKF